MESLFARQAPKRQGVLLMVAGSLVFHGGLVGIGALFVPAPSKEPVVVDWIPMDEGGNPTPVSVVEPPQQIEVNTEPTATPDVAEPTADTPPLVDDPVFAEPFTPAPHQRVVVRTAAAPRNSMSRPFSQVPGVVVSTASNAPGMGLGSSIPSAWTMPHPPYPSRLHGAPATGVTTVRITTDAAGRITDVVIVQSAGNPVLDAHTVSYVRANWRGPANASRTTQFVYQLR